jgi:uncharacterized protein YndB with AHSA1/START domain
MAMLHLLLSVLLTVLACVPAHAAEVGANGFAIRFERSIHAPPLRVYDALAGQVGMWWNPQHTYSGDSRNLSIDARPGGCFCERAPDNGIEHMRVIHVKQGEMLRLSGGLGPLQGLGLAGAMTWRVRAARDGSTLELTYNVGGFLPGGFEELAPAVERVLAEQVDRLKRFVETGAPDAVK